MSRRAHIAKMPVLNGLVVLQSVAYTKDSMGEKGPGVWSDVAELPADVEYGAAKEIVPKNGKPYSQQKITVKIHYRAGMVATNRLKHLVDGQVRYYQINGIANVGGQNLLLVLNCTWKIN